MFMHHEAWVWCGECDPLPLTVERGTGRGPLTHQIVFIEVKIGGGLWGLDPHWKTDNPHCKRQGKKLGGSGFDPTWA